MPAPPTSPRLLYAGEAHAIAATADGYAILETTTSIFAVPLAGGAPLPIADRGTAQGTYPVALVYGVAVVLPNRDNPHVTLVWTAASGVHSFPADTYDDDVYSISPGRVVPTSLAVLPDGSRVAYRDADDGSFVEANVDGSNAITIFPAGDGCGAAAPVAPGFVAVGCPVPPGVDAGGASIDLFDAGGARTHLLTTTSTAFAPLVVSDATSTILVSGAEADGHLRLHAFPIAGGAPTTLLDVASPGAQLVGLTPNGSHVVWKQPDGNGYEMQYWAISSASPSPMALATLPGGALPPSLFSPDGTWLIDSSTALSTTSTRTVAIPDLGPVANGVDVFTADSQYFLLKGSVISLATSAVTPFSTSDFALQPYSGARFVYIDVGDDAGPQTIQGMLTAVSAAAPSVEMRIDEAEAAYAFDAAHTGVVYTRPGASPGVYYVALP